MFMLFYGLVVALALPCHAQVRTTSSEVCTTKYGSTSVANPGTTTSTTVKTSTVTAKVTSTPSTTVTKATPTVTQTATSTVSISKTIASTKGTVTSTTTQTATSSSTVTSFVTSGVTSTSDAGTTYTATVPTPSGFLPLAQEPGYAPKIKGRSPNAEAEDIVRRQGTSPPPKHPDPSSNPPQPNSYPPDPSSYPTATSCNLITQVYSTTVSTATAKSTKTITSTPAAQTTVKTVMKTTTITFDGRTTITKTASTTVFATTTVTGTTTTTNTVVIATPASYYAACDAKNLVSTANGNASISQSRWAYDSTLSFSQISPITAYDCCTLCQRTTGCQWITSSGGSYCLVVTRSVCNPGTPYTVPNGQYGTIDIFYTDPSNQYPLVLGNGPCGAISNGGDISNAPN